MQGRAFRAEGRAGLHLMQGPAGRRDEDPGAASLCPVQAAGDE